MKEKIRKILHIKTLAFIVFTFACIGYYGRKYYEDRSLSFTPDNSLLLIGIMLAMFWVMIFCTYSILENRHLIKENGRLIKENQILLGKIIDQNTEHALRSEQQYHEVLKSNQNTREILLSLELDVS
jgi:hypothetical protein